ncbi:hypothetical protein QMK33_04470 [Hymenobacter sp. H14-R3]|uniref:hypothetical protein n=1 Tax=Hymenobacter sp. H14-R3 TaxID=3046308 RepID=UPI0024B92CB7|nr:hypothetical protein [Hymenobacter sp. H14-R3]MDJ0364395.1 hypothetical protein [Hymenobacter sp. H14-R3]
MKFRTHVLAFVCGAFAALAAPAAHAQVSLNAQFGHPTWGPAAPAGAQYYYVPEIDGYYDLAARNYLVQRNGRWTPIASMQGYNPSSFHPVVVAYRGRQPWAQYNDHHARYYRRPVAMPVRRPVAMQQPGRRPVIVQKVNRRGQLVTRTVR